MKISDGMNPLSQYIDLYKARKELVDNASSPVINALRDEACDILEHTVLPPKGSENYETISIGDLLAPDYGINLNRINIDVNAVAPFRCGVPNLTPAIFFFRNDIYAESADCRKNFPEGLYVGSLKNFCCEYPLMAQKYYGKIADMRNPIVALNSLLVQDGIVIWVKENVKVNFPIQIVSILENGAPLMAFRRILVIAEKNAEINILTCDHTQSSDIDLFTLQVSEIEAGENAKVSIYEMEESTEKTVRLSSLYSKQKAFSNLSGVGVTLFNGTTRNEYHCTFEGRNADLKLSGMAIADKSRSIDNFSEVIHTYPECHTDELFKYVIDDNATGTFSGMIKVEKGAVRTEAYQNNRNIIGNDGARVYSKPRLEIYDDDVKCSHGSATGQLDEKQIFYMRTRGLSEDTARFLLKQAFMADVIDRIDLPEFKMRLHSLVERRFAGENSNCTTCRNNCLPND